MTASTSRRRGSRGSAIDTRVVGYGGDDGEVGDGTCVGFQTLEKRRRAFLLLRQGQKRITLTAVPHSPGLPPPLCITRASTGSSRRRRAGGRERRLRLSFLGLHDIPPEGHLGLGLTRQVGQPFWRSVWRCAALPSHGRVVPEQTHDGKDKTMVCLLVLPWCGLHCLTCTTRVGLRYIDYDIG
jgi:hypothetical protein